LEQSIIARVKTDLFSKPWRSKNEFLNHASQVNSKILQYGQHILDLIEPVLKAFADTHILVQKLIANNIGNTPLLKFIKDTQEQMHSLVPVDFPLIYDFSRMKDLPRYLKALALRAQRGSLNLAAAQNKLQEIAVYSEQYFEMKKNIIPETTEDKKRKIEEFFWMIEEYKVSLFAQELKTPYPVSPKKLTKFIEEIQNTI